MVLVCAYCWESLVSGNGHITYLTIEWKQSRLHQMYLLRWLGHWSFAGYRINKYIASFPSRFIYLPRSGRLCFLLSSFASGIDTRDPRTRTFTINTYKHTYIFFEAIRYIFVLFFMWKLSPESLVYRQIEKGARNKRKGFITTYIFSHEKNWLAQSRLSQFFPSSSLFSLAALIFLPDTAPPENKGGKSVVW